MNISQKKKEIRIKVLKKRSLLDKKFVTEESQQISENFIQNLVPRLNIKPNDIWAIYLDSYNEVETSFIRDFFQKNNIKFSYPKIIKKDFPLDFILASKEQEFTNSKIYPAILEAKNGKIVIPDFLILPLVAFDKKKSRLGMGGGFFDRTIGKLKKQNKNITTIALAYDFQRVEQDLETEKTDQSLDFIVTKNNVFS